MAKETEIIDCIYDANENFLARANQELVRAQRYLSFVSYIMVDASHLSRSGEIDIAGSESEFCKKLRKHIRISIRQTDLVSGFKNGRVCVLLVETGHDGVKVVGERLQESFRYFLHEMVNSPKNWRVEIRSGSFPGNETTANSFLQKIKADLIGTN